MNPISADTASLPIRTFDNALRLPEPCNGVVISGHALDSGEVTYEFRRANGEGWVTTDIRSNGNARTVFESWFLVRAFLIRTNLRFVEYLEY